MLFRASHTSLKSRHAGGNVIEAKIGPVYEKVLKWSVMTFPRLF